ncbi:MAG: hypothetical protein ACLGHT_13015, partial [Acidimicrobiia bacterium]
TPEEDRRRRRRRRRAGGPPSEPVNDQVTFLRFVSDYQPGAEVPGEVESFASHGAFVVAAGARCYIPLSGMGDPPPRAAREVLERGETRTFVVQAFDTPRRGIELALPGFVHPAGGPTEETVEAEIAEAHPEPSSEPEPAPAARRRKKAAASKKVAATKKAAASKKAPAKKAVAAKKAAPAKKVAAKKAPPAKKAPAKKAVAANKAAPAKKATAAKKTAPAKKAVAAKKVAKKAAKKRT